MPDNKLQKVQRETQALTTSVPEDRIRRLLELSRRQKSANTQRAYVSSLRDFAKWCGVDDINDAVVSLLRAGPSEATIMAHEYMDSLKERGLSRRTIGVRLSALKSVVKDAQAAEIIHWNLSVKAPKVSRKSNVRGPTPEEFAKVKALADERATTVIGLRNRAIVYLAAFGGYRRDEIVSLDVEHVDRQRKRIYVNRKGDDEEREWRSVGAHTFQALCDYLDASGHDTGPLIRNADRSGKGKSPRLTGTSVWRIVTKMGKAAGIDLHLHPHAFRHFSTTEIIEATDGNVVVSQKHTGHADPAILISYIDERKDEVRTAMDLVEARWFDEED